MNAYESWKKEQEKRKRGEFSPYTQQAKKSDGTAYKGSGKDTSSYQWEKDLVGSKRNKYGKNYDDRYTNMMNAMGVTNAQEQDNFRKWMDYQEKRPTFQNETKLKNKENPRYQFTKMDEMAKPSQALTDSIINRKGSLKYNAPNYVSPSEQKFNEHAPQWAKDVKEYEYQDKLNAFLKKLSPKYDKDGDGKRDGLFGALDNTLGRVSKAANRQLFDLGGLIGNDFTNEAFQKKAEELQKQGKVNVYGRAGEKADNIGEKALEGFGTVAGMVAPYAGVGGGGSLLANGVTSLTRKGLAKEAINQGAKVTAKQAAKTGAKVGALEGAGFGALAGGIAALNQEDVKQGAKVLAQQLAANALGGAVFGGAIGGIAQGISNKLAKKIPLTQSEQEFAQVHDEAVAKATEQPQTVQNNQQQPMQEQPIPKPLLALPAPQVNPREKLQRLTDSGVLNPNGRVNPQRLSEELTNKLDSFAYELNQTNPADLKKQVPKSTGGNLDEMAQGLSEDRSGLTKAIETQYELIKKQRDEATYTPSSHTPDNKNYQPVSTKPEWMLKLQGEYGTSRIPNYRLKEIAREQVTKGYNEQGVDVPAYNKNQAEIDKVDTQIEEVTNMMREYPEESEALMPILKGLEQDKAGLSPKEAPLPQTMNELPITNKVTDKPQTKTNEAQDLVAMLRGDKKVNEAAAKLQPNPKVLGEGMAEDTLKKAENVLDERVAKKNQADLQTVITKLQKADKPLTKANIQKGLDALKPKAAPSKPLVFKKEKMVSQPKKSIDAIKRFDDTLSDEKALSVLGEDSKLALNLQLFSDFKAQFNTKGKTVAEVQKSWKKFKENEWIHVAELESIGETVTPKLLKQYKEFKKKYPEYVGNKDFNRHFQAYKQGKAVTTPATKEVTDDVDAAGEIKKQVSYREEKKKRTTIKDIMNQVYIKLVDDTYGITKAEKEIGKNIKDADSATALAQTARGVAEKSKQTLERGSFDEYGNKVGDSFSEIIKDTDEETFSEYLVARSVLDYDKQGMMAIETNGYNQKELAEKAIKEIETKHPEYKEKAKQIYAYQNRLLDELEDAGMISKEQRKQLNEANPNYVPMMREMEDELFRSFGNNDKSYANVGEPYKKRTGSKRKVVNPLESIVKRTFITQSMAARNKVGRSLLHDVLKDGGETPFAKVVKVDKVGDKDNLLQRIGEITERADDELPDTINEMFNGGKGKNTITVWDNGNKYTLEVKDKLFYESMLSLDSKALPLWMKAVNYPVRLLRAGVTLSPDFALRNAVRDQLQTAIVSDSGYNPLDFLRGAKEVLKYKAGKESKEVESYLRNGGGQSVFGNIDRNAMQETINEFRGNKTAMEKAKNVLAKPYQYLSNIGEISELSTRVGHSMKGQKKGLSPQQAAYNARKTMDFNRAGTWGRQINQGIAFFNAAIQGVDVVARAFKDNPIRTSVNIGKYVVAPTLALYYLNNDEEWYQEIPLKDRDMNWYIKAGDEIIKIPKPFEVGTYFGSSVERSLEAMKKKDPKEFEGFTKELFSAVSPADSIWDVIPTALLPWIEVMSGEGGYNSHFKSPIVPQSEAGLPKDQQSGPYTSGIAKGVGKLTNTSPRKIDHLVRGYTGTMGGYMTDLVDFAGNAATGKESKRPDYGVQSTPFVRSFVVKNLEGNNRSVDDFYKTLKKLQTLKNGGRASEKQLVELKAMNKTKSEMNEYNKQKRELMKAEMPRKEKADELKKLNEFILKLAKTHKE